MKTTKLVSGLLLLLFAGQALAYESKEAMIDDKLSILADADYARQVETLQGLQWSGLSDARLFDKIAELPASEYRQGMNRHDLGLMAHRVRALGYSGNPKYRSLLEDIEATAAASKLKRHARSALADLERYQRWNQLLAQSDFSVSGKSYEVTTYMKMLQADDITLQRLAAQGLYHERRYDPDLLAMIADKLIASYRQDGLDGDTQDTMAWFCKTLGNNALTQYRDLLSEVNNNTPYPKIRKYASQYAN